MSSAGRSSSNGLRPSYREATRNTHLSSGPHTQHFAPPSQVSTPIPRKASVASSSMSSASATSTAASSSAVHHGRQPSVRRPSADAGYVSSQSADALLSDVKPLTVDLVTLGMLNELLDEFLLDVVYAAGGLATPKLKLALPAILPNPLARAAIEEAELELLSWLDSSEGTVWRGVGELPLGRGRDWNDSGGREGAGRDAGRLMRVMTQAYSTLGDRAPNDETELAHVQAFKMKGGDIRQGILDSSALYLTAIIEWTAEYILTSLGRVMGHGGQHLSSVGVQQLWDALSEDEALYAMLRGMKVRETIESTLGRQHARNSRRQAKALSKESSSVNPSSSAMAVLTSAPVPSMGSTSSRHKHPFSSAAGEAAATTPTSSLGDISSPANSSSGLAYASATGRSSLSSNAEGTDGASTAAAWGGLGAISEQASRSGLDQMTSAKFAHARVPPVHGTTGQGAHERLSVESTMSQPSSVFIGRDGRDFGFSRKSTSSNRPSKGLLESVLGFDQTKKSSDNRDQLEGGDEFEALLKGGGTKKMSLTPVVMKRTGPLIVEAVGVAKWN